MSISEVEVIEREPLNGSTPREALLRTRTPTSSFFVRNHFPVPEVDAGSWRLRIEGGTNGSRSYALDDLRGFGRASATATLECAGNGRHRFEPAVAGLPWDDRAVGTAGWEGVPLRPVLQEAGSPADAVEVLFTGLDRGEEGGRTIPFQRSLPLAEAMRDDVLLCDTMNGERLTPDHGAPLRLLVPGWYGVASVKWLAEVRFLDEPFEGWFQRDRYVYRHAEDEAGEPVDRMRPKSLILEPADGASVPAGRPIRVTGIAWSGYGAVERVEVSGDGGRTWQRAELGAAPDRYAAHRFEAELPGLDEGSHRLVSRAVDEQGRTQPQEPVWNRHGYGQNAVVPVRVEARQDPA